MDCWPYIFTLFSNQYWRPFVYPSIVLPFLPTGQTRGKVPRVAWLRRYTLATGANVQPWTTTSRRHMWLGSYAQAQTTQHSGCQPGARHRPSAMASRCRQFRRATPPKASAALRRTYQTSEFYNTFNSTANSPMGLDLKTPWSWGLTRAGTQTVPHGHGSAPGSAQQLYMAAMVWIRLWPGLTPDATASSTVSRVQPTPCQSYAIQTNKSYTDLWTPSRGHPPWPRLQSTYWTPLSDWDSTVLDVYLRVWTV